MREFTENLGPINALAEAAPGYVWRLQDAHGDATAIRAHPDPLVIINLSVWESVESLQHFVYQTVHQRFLKDRRNWFEKWSEGVWFVLWWVPAGHHPTTAEALDRLARLRAEGQSAEAFDFRRPFPPPAA